MVKFFSSVTTTTTGAPPTTSTEAPTEAPVTAVEPPREEPVTETEAPAEAPATTVAEAPAEAQSKYDLSLYKYIVYSHFTWYSDTIRVAYSCGCVIIDTSVSFKAYSRSCICVGQVEPFWAVCV